jgi:hypothetical protein
MPETQEPQESPVGLKGFLKERTCEKRRSLKMKKEEGMFTVLIFHQVR